MELFLPFVMYLYANQHFKKYFRGKPWLCGIFVAPIFREKGTKKIKS